MRGVREFVVDNAGSVRRRWRPWRRVWHEVYGFGVDLLVTWRGYVVAVLVLVMFAWLVASPAEAR